MAGTGGKGMGFPMKDIRVFVRLLFISDMNGSSYEVNSTPAIGTALKNTNN